MMHRPFSTGFTLIETVIVIAVTGVVLMTLTSLIVYFYRTNTYALEQTIALGQARTGIQDTVRYLREASYGSDGSYPIASAGTSTITFFAKIDSTPVVERITYRLIAGTLYRVVATPSGNPVTYVGASLATSTISIPVVNSPSTPIFRYFDNNGIELTSPVNVSKIASIKVTIVVDVNVEKAPISFTLSGGATLRNLNTQL